MPTVPSTAAPKYGLIFHSPYIGDRLLFTVRLGELASPSWSTASPKYLAFYVGKIWLFEPVFLFSSKINNISLFL